MLLLLFNVVYENAAGKGQLVRAGGVEAVVSAIKRGLEEGDQGTVTVVHGMGVMFDLLRIDFEGQEGTCLGSVAAKAVREAAKAKGFAKVLEDVKDKKWKQKGVDLQRMAEAMLEGISQ